MFGSLSVVGLACISYFIYANCETSDAAFKKPHIIFILADDMGWNDVSFHGSNEIPTPNIDALAYNGVILNRHYALPICSPTRSSLLTGRYAIRDGMQGVPLGPGELRGIPLNTTLMPNHLRKLGYETHLVGKWHLGYYTNNHTPTRRGFDTFYGYYNGFITYFKHTIGLITSDLSLRVGYDMHRDDSESLKVPYDSGYFTNLITDEAEKIIRNNRGEKPLFLEISHLGVHSNGNEDDPLEVPDMKDVNATYPYIKDLKRRKYAGVMKTLDESVGRIVTALGDAQMLQDSIIVFMSDNGAPTIDKYANTGSNYPMRGIKNTLFEGGVRVAACIFSPRIKSSSRLSEKLMHVVDWLPTLYAAAGGDVGDLGSEIDGMNQWPMILGKTESARESMLLNIDEVTGCSAAILRNHKLVKNATSLGEGYYGEAGNDPSFPRYHAEDALSSATGLAISKIPGFASPTPLEAQYLREKSVVRCKQPKIYPNCSTLCLFNVQDDPCETKDLSKEQPEIIKELAAFIDSYQPFLISQGSEAIDPLSFPENFNGTWMPWIADELLTSQIF